MPIFIPRDCTGPAKRKFSAESRSSIQPSAVTSKTNEKFEWYFYLEWRPHCTIKALPRKYWVCFLTLPIRQISSKTSSELSPSVYDRPGPTFSSYPSQEGTVSRRKYQQKVSPKTDRKSSVSGIIWDFHRYIWVVPWPIFVKCGRFSWNYSYQNGNISILKASLFQIQK